MVRSVGSGLPLCGERTLTDQTGFPAKVIECAGIILPQVSHTKTPVIPTTFHPWPWGMVALVPRAEQNPRQSQSRQSLGRFNRAQQRREAQISLAAEAAVNAERAQLLLQVQQKHVRQEHCYKPCDLEPEPAAKRLQPPGGLLLQTGCNEGEIAAEVEVNTDWTIHPSSCSGDPYAKVAQLEEKLKDVEKENKALREQVTSGSKKKVFGVDLIKDNNKKT